MRHANSKAVDFDIADAKRCPGLETIQARRELAPRNSGAVSRVMKIGTLSKRASATRPLT